MLSMERVDDVGLLQYNEAEWEQGWFSLGGQQVYIVKMALSGHPGRIRITAGSSKNGVLETRKTVKLMLPAAVQISSAPTKPQSCHPASAHSLSSHLAVADPLQLNSDAVELELRAGTPATLCIDGLARLDCGTRAVISQLRVRVVDNAGNPTTTSETFDITINASALATDGSGRCAAVSVNGGNKTKMKKGAAVFKDVRVKAEEAGSYALRVQAASRKVALADAVLMLAMAPQNAVTSLSVFVPEGAAREGFQVRILCRC